MSVSFDTPDENNAFRDRFQALVNQADEQLNRLENRTPQEYYFCKLILLLKRLKTIVDPSFKTIV
jgi:hypothetical protein